MLLSCGCIEISSLRELTALRSSIADRFTEPGVSIDLNNRVHLIITFQNSSRADLPAEERGAFAREVAIYVREHYPGHGELRTISVGFTTRRGFGPVAMTRTEVPYRFTPPDLDPASYSAPVVERGGGRSVTLESFDRLHALGYSCDRFEAAAQSAATERVIRTHARRIARQVTEQRDQATLQRLMAAYEGPDPRLLEKLVVDYVCRHGVVLERTSAPVFPEPGSTAREFVLKQLTFEPPYDDGRLVRLSDYRGQVVVLDVFATWCAPCVEKYPGLGALAERYQGRGVQFLGIAPHDGPDSLASWLLENGGVPPYPFLLAHDARAFKRAWRPHGLPEMFVIDHVGYIVDHCLGCQTGPMSTDSLPRLLDSLLEARGNGM